jgi:hypothetical protein
MVPSTLYLGLLKYKQLKLFAKEKLLGLLTFPEVDSNLTPVTTDKPFNNWAVA